MNTLKLKLERNGLSYFKVILCGLGIIFALFTLGMTLYNSDAKNIFCCLSTVMLVCLPPVVGVLLRFKISTPMYVFFTAYALAPMLGSVYKLYYNTTWWDDVLHIAGGVVFAMFGMFLVTLFNKNKKPSLALCVVFAFCFSMTISALWEMFEFASDCLIHTDMQRDSIINAIYSHDFAQNAGDVESIEGIKDVLVNGKPLGFDGYLDIGLIDTMKDMIVEGLGALIYVIIVAIDRDRHPVLVPLEPWKRKSKKEK